MKDILSNQIALALLVFIVIVIGAYMALDAPTAKEIIVQIITATGSLVTGYAVGRGKRSTDKGE